MIVSVSASLQSGPWKIARNFLGDEEGVTF